jgi:hypothetical protein
MVCGKFDEMRFIKLFLSDDNAKKKRCWACGSLAVIG